MAKLLLNGGTGQAQELELRGGVSRVGRSSANDIQIEHPSVSGSHCEISCSGDSVTIKDLGSTNGTFIERAPIREASLAHGQRLQLGSVEMVFDAGPSGVRVAPASPAPPPGTLPPPPKARLSVQLGHSATATAAGAGAAPAGAQQATPPRPTSSLNAYQKDPSQVEQEARSKIFWGDTREEVLKYVRMQGLGIEEASSLVESIFQERIAALRGIGIRKICFGVGLICVPVVSFFVFLHMGFFPLKIFAVTIMVGLWGAWMVLKGCFMLFAPKSEPGDVADK